MQLYLKLVLCFANVVNTLAIALVVCQFRLGDLATVSAIIILSEAADMWLQPAVTRYVYPNLRSTAPC